MLANIPADIFGLIIGLLSHEDLRAISLVSRRLYYTIFSLSLCIPIPLTDVRAGIKRFFRIHDQTSAIDCLKRVKKLTFTTTSTEHCTIRPIGPTSSLIKPRADTHMLFPKSWHLSLSLIFDHLVSNSVTSFVYATLMSLLRTRLTFKLGLPFHPGDDSGI